MQGLISDILQNFGHKDDINACDNKVKEKKARNFEKNHIFGFSIAIVEERMS